MEIEPNATEGEWAEIASRCAWATFFQTPKWARIVRRAFTGCEVVTPLARTRGGTSIVMPMMRSVVAGGSNAHSYVSTMPFAYGGPIADHDLDERTLGKVTGAMFRSLRPRAYSVTVYGNPHRSEGFGLKASATRGCTHVVDLAGGMDAVRSRYSDGHRSAVIKARKAGVTGRRAHHVDDWAKYFQLYQATLERWGERTTTTYGWELFESMRDEQGDDLALWLAEYQNEIVAGAIVGYAGSRGFYWHAASSSDHSRLRPNNFLQDTILEDACRRQLSEYDTLSSGGMSGVVRFKESFGAREREFTNLTWRCGLASRLIMKIGR